jgi:hypothetical protein
MSATTTRTGLSGGHRVAKPRKGAGVGTIVTLCGGRGPGWRG